MSKFCHFDQLSSCAEWRQRLRELREGGKERSEEGGGGGVKVERGV